MTPPCRSASELGTRGHPSVRGRLSEHPGPGRNAAKTRLGVQKQACSQDEGTPRPGPGMPIHVSSAGNEPFTVADPEPERPVPPVGPPGRRPPGSRPGPSLPTRRRPARGSAGPAGAAAADHRRMPTPVGSNRAGSPSRWPASGRCATLRTPASTETGRRRARPRDPLGRRDSWCGTAA
jgi:hypothetical protein